MVRQRTSPFSRGSSLKLSLILSKIYLNLNFEESIRLNRITFSAIHNPRHMPRIVDRRKKNLQNSQVSHNMQKKSKVGSYPHYAKNQKENPHRRSR